MNKRGASGRAAGAVLGHVHLLDVDDDARPVFPPRQEMALPRTTPFPMIIISGILGFSVKDTGDFIR